MSEPSDSDVQTTDNSALPKLGELLRETREQRNLSIEDVSNRLRLSPRQINALENNDFKAFPEAVMTRGFLRNYARFLDLEVEPVMAAYRVHVPAEAQHSLSINSANVLIPNGVQRSYKLFFILAGIIIVAIVGWLLYQDYVSDHQAPPADAHVVGPVPPIASSQSTGEAMPQAALPYAERTPEATPEPAPVESSTPVAPAAATPAAAIPGLAVAPVPGAAESATAANAPLMKLKFSFTAQAWVSVTDRQGKQIFNKTKAAGSEDEVAGEPPLKLILGNASATKVLFKDQAVDLAPYTKSNVARLTLALE